MIQTGKQSRQTEHGRHLDMTVGLLVEQTVTKAMALSFEVASSSLASMGTVLPDGVHGVARNRDSGPSSSPCASLP